MIIVGESPVMLMSMGGWLTVSNDRMEASSSGTMEAIILSSLKSLESSVWQNIETLSRDNLLSSKFIILKKI